MLLHRISESGMLNSLREMDQLRHRLNQLLSANSGGNGAFPPVDVWTSEEGAIVRAEVAGIAPEDIELYLVNETLTISGERKPEPLAEGESYQRQERAYGKFTRSFQLPFRIDGEKVEAKFAHGILTITLARAEADKPRKITVNPN